MCVKLLESCPTLTVGSSVHGVLQERILKWVNMPPLGDLSDSGIKLSALETPALPADSLLLSHCLLDIYLSNIVLGNGW